MSNSINNALDITSQPSLTLYVIADDGDPMRHKVGYSSNPMKRFKQIQSGTSRPLRLIYQQVHPAAPTVEARVKAFLAPVAEGREWFAISADVMIALIQKTAERFDEETDQDREHDTHLTFRAPRRLAGQFKRQAGHLGISCSELLRQLIRDYLDESEPSS